MEGPVESVTPPTASPRTRRRPHVVLALAAAVCVLLGRGFGLYGTAAEAEPSTPAARPEPSTSAVGSPAGKPTTNTVAESPREQPTAHAAPAVPPPMPIAERAAEGPASAPTAAAPGIDGDRFASLMSLVRVRCEHGELGTALAVLAQARAMPLDAVQHAELQGAEVDVRQVLTTTVQQIADQLRSGQVLAARTAAGRLLREDPEWALAPLAATLGLAAGVDLLRVPLPAEQPWPIPVPLAKDRSVRAQVHQRTESGRVIDSRSDQVTLRVQGEHGVTFPTVPVVACEPVDPTPAEAVEMGLAALHGNDPLLARLWLVCAQQRSAEPATPRAQQVTALLR